MAEINIKRHQCLTLHQEQLDRMQEEISKHVPEEACGLLAGRQDEIQVILPIENELHSPTRFRMAPQELIQAFQWLENNGMEMIASYHSHPQGPEQPSITDIAEAYYPELITLIWSPVVSTWKCKAFVISKGYVEEIPVNIVPNSNYSD